MSPGLAFFHLGVGRTYEPLPKQNPKPQVVLLVIAADFDILVAQRLAINRLMFQKGFWGDGSNMLDFATLGVGRTFRIRWRLGSGTLSLGIVCVDRTCDAEWRH